MTNKGLNKLLVIAIVAPIVALLLIAGGSVIWQGIVTVFTAIVPNIWTLLAYIYVAFIAFIIGAKVGKKSTSKK